MKTNPFIKLVLIASLAVGLTSCHKDEDDTKKTCKTECTVVMGRVVTANNQPVPDANLNVVYEENHGIFYSVRRKKAVAKSDKNGCYEMRFYVKDDELNIGGDEDNGAYYRTFHVNVEMKGIDHNKYLLPYNLSGESEEIAIMSASYKFERDDMAECDFYIPLKRVIPVTIKDFTPVQSGDFCDIIVAFPYGHGGEPNSAERNWTSMHREVDKSQANEEGEVTVMVPFALNEENRVQILKRKNGGLATSEEYTVTVTSSDPQSLTYTY